MLAAVVGWDGLSNENRRSEAGSRMGHKPALRVCWPRCAVTPHPASLPHSTTAASYNQPLPAPLRVCFTCFAACDHLEAAYIRDVVAAEKYTPLCNNLIGKFRIQVRRGLKLRVMGEGDAAVSSLGAGDVGAADTPR